jgi:glutathione S-transferase
VRTCERFFLHRLAFARAVRIVLDELNLDCEKREEITTPSVQQCAAASLTLQVPTCWDGDVRLWESGLIAECLLHTYEKRPDAEPPLSERAGRTSSEWRDRLILSTTLDRPDAGHR